LVAGATQIYVNSSLREIGTGPFIRIVTPISPGSLWLKNFDDDASNSGIGNGLIDNGFPGNAACNLTFRISLLPTQVGNRGWTGNLNLPNSVFAPGTTIGATSALPQRPAAASPHLEEGAA